MHTAAPVDEEIPRWSLKEQSWLEACTEAWIRSEEAGMDVGAHAVQQWIHQHWPGFLRARWIEHLRGIRFWAELRRDDFGILRHVPPHQLHLLDLIIERLVCGGDNLSLTTWYIRERDAADRKDILDLLTRIDINSCRLRCSFEDKYIERDTALSNDTLPSSQTADLLATPLRSKLDERAQLIAFYCTPEFTERLITHFHGAKQKALAEMKD